MRIIFAKEEDHGKTNRPRSGVDIWFWWYTLPRNMQEFSFIKALEMRAEEFWKKAGVMTQRNDASKILCYMKLMLDEASKQISLKRESFKRFGEEVALFLMVCWWLVFADKQIWPEKGLEIRHYINSSGLKEMIEYNYADIVNAPVPQRWRCSGMAGCRCWLHDKNPVSFQN